MEIDIGSFNPFSHYMETYSECQEDIILRFVDILTLLPIDKDDNTGKIGAIEKYKEKVSFEKKEFELSLANEIYAAYAIEIKFSNIDKILLDSEKIGILQDRSKIKNEIIKIITELMDRKIHRIKWKKIKYSPHQPDDEISRINCKKIIYYTGYMTNRFTNSVTFITKSKKKIKADKEKYINKMRELLQNIDKLYSSNKSQEQIQTEFAITCIRIKILLNVYINNITVNEDYMKFKIEKILKLLQNIDELYSSNKSQEQIQNEVNLIQFEIETLLGSCSDNITKDKDWMNQLLIGLKYHPLF
jgi:hypothetical protein